MTTTGDELLARIRQAVVETGVPPSQRDRVTELVGRCVVTIMSDPAFYSQLRVVMDLAQENQLLRQQLAQMAALNGALKSAVAVKLPRKAPARAKTKARKTPPSRAPKVTPKVQVKGSTAANRKAFREGYRGK